MSPKPEEPTAASEPRDPGGLRGVVWAWAVIATASVALLLFNAASVRSWVAQQPADVLPTAVEATTERWWSLTDRVGLTAPRAVIGRLWSVAGGLRWPELMASRSAAPQR